MVMSVLCSDRTVDIASICVNRHTNPCGGDQLYESLSNSTFANDKVMDYLPQVDQLCSDNYTLLDFSEAFNMYTHIAPQHSLPPGRLLVALMETGHHAFPTFPLLS